MTADIARPVRRRPKDRKRQILLAAARAFSERGYHPVGVDEIAAEVGISGPALYRHFPNKYALLVAVAENSAQTMMDVAAAADSDAEPAQRLHDILAALSAMCIENRRGGGLYRWERRYLEREDRRRIRKLFDGTFARIEAPLALLRPGLPADDVMLISRALLSAVASISAHRTTLSNPRIEAVLAEICASVTMVDLPAPDPGPAAPETGLAVTARRERLLTVALQIFAARGYHEASIDEIATAAGLTPSSVYRYFDSKAALLSAAFYRASDQVAVSLSRALGESSAAAEAISRVAQRFLAWSFANPEMAQVYFAEFGNLPAEEQSRLRAAQRDNVDEWVNLLVELGCEPVVARFRVHAAFSIGLDIGQVVRFDRRPATLARTHALIMGALRA